MDHVARHAIVTDLLLAHCIKDLALETVGVSELVVGECLVELDKLVDEDAEDVVVNKLKLSHPELLALGAVVLYDLARQALVERLMALAAAWRGRKLPLEVL